MPFVANGPDDEENQQNSAAQGPVPPSGSGPVNLTPSAGVGTVAPGGSTASKAAPGGQFATLNQYLNANQGQAAPLANKITGQIGQQYNTLNQANNATISGLNNEVANAPGYTASNNALIAQESANPTSFASDPNNVRAFQGQLTDSYGGPTSAEGDSGYQTQQAALNTAIANGQAQTQTQAGQQQLIAQNSAAPTAGVTALNSAIVSQDPTYLGQIEGAYQPFNNLVTNLGTGAANVDKTIASEQADAANAAGNSLNAITGQENNLNNTVNNAVSADQTAGTAQNAAVTNAFTTGQATPAILSTLGITQDQWNALSAADKAAATSQYVQSANGQWGAQSGTANIDNTQFLTQQDPNAVYDAANVATADQYGQAGAFNTLLSGLNLQTPQLVIDPANAAQAGTAPTNLNTFNDPNALAAAQTASVQEQAAAQAYVAALQSGADEAHAQAAASNAAKDANIAGGVGSAVGTGIGGYFGGPIGAEAGAAIGNVAGRDALSQAGMFATDITNPSIKNSIPIAENIATLGLSSTINTIKNIFCFHPWTLIDMADGTLKSIWKIEVGDETRGGKVLATTRGVGTEFYWYQGVLVTGKHAVKESGVWIRVETSPLARKFNYLTEVVCNLVTTSHRIYSSGNEFADEHETDNYEMLDLDESLQEMNRIESVR